MGLISIKLKQHYAEAIKFDGTEESADQIIKYFDNHKSLSKYVYISNVDGIKYISIHYTNADGDRLVQRAGTYFIGNEHRYGGFETMSEKEFNWKYERI